MWGPEGCKSTKSAMTPTMKTTTLATLLGIFFGLEASFNAGRGSIRAGVYCCCLVSQTGMSKLEGVWTSGAPLLQVSEEF